MWRTFLGTLGLLLGGLAGLAALFFGVGSLVMLSSGAIVVLPLLGAVIGVLAGWRLDKRKNAGDRGHHRTWKSILGTLSWPLGGLAGVAALRALCIYGQTRFSEADLVDYFFMPLSAAIVVLALLGAGMGQIVGVLVGRRLDKRLNTEDRRHHSRHRLTAACVVGGAAIVGLALGAYCCTFVVRTLSGPPDILRVVYLRMRLDAEPDQAGTVVSELIRIGADSKKNAGIRESALRCVGYKVGPEDKAAVPALINGLENSDPDVRGYCVAALGRIGPNAKSAVPQLTRALQDKELSVQRLAADSLALIQPNASAEPAPSQDSERQTQDTPNQGESEAELD